MGKKILISINPTHVNNILLGLKKFEYRTKKPKCEIKSLIIYCTSPVKKVVAEVKVEKILSGNINEIWNKTESLSGINKMFYKNYFKNRNIAYAYKLGNVLKFDEPKMLEDFGFNHAPQSFCYVN